MDLVVDTHLRVLIFWSLQSCHESHTVYDETHYAIAVLRLQAANHTGARLPNFEFQQKECSQKSKNMIITKYCKCEDNWQLLRHVQKFFIVAVLLFAWLLIECCDIAG